MEVALVTVGDELLSGRTENTNASWLARELTDRGVTVETILTIPDDQGRIATEVRRLRSTVDALVVTGGIGGTPDDVTMEAVASALGRDERIHPVASDHVSEKLETLRETRPALLKEVELADRLEAAATIPAGGEPILVEEAWAPGCVVENVYVFAGIPAEMRAMFDAVSDDFHGDRITRTIVHTEPEGAIRSQLEEANEHFSVRIGSYPPSGDRDGRVTVTGEDEAAVASAVAWLADRIDRK